MGAIVLDLRPGLGIGPFSLGMPICEAFDQIEQQPNIYDVVHVKYLDEDPLKLDIVISLPDHGFHLRFDPWSQRLRLIEIFDVKRLQMRYAATVIGGPSTLATFVAVYSTFGPTFPGIYDKDRGVYTLFYPGLSFSFRFLLSIRIVVIMEKRSCPWSSQMALLQLHAVSLSMIALQIVKLVWVH